jgi:hypothetical protein
MTVPIVINHKLHSRVRGGLVFAPDAEDGSGQMTRMIYGRKIDRMKMNGNGRNGLSKTWDSYFRQRQNSTTRPLSRQPLALSPIVCRDSLIKVWPNSV